MYSTRRTLFRTVRHFVGGATIYGALSGNLQARPDEKAATKKEPGPERRRWSDAVIDPKAWLALEEMNAAYFRLRAFSAELIATNSWEDAKTEGRTTWRQKRNIQLAYRRPNRAAVTTLMTTSDGRRAHKRALGDGVGTYVFPDLDHQPLGYQNYHESDPGGWPGTLSEAVSGSGSGWVDLSSRFIGLDPYRGILQSVRSVAFGSPVERDDVPCVTVIAKIDWGGDRATMMFHIGREDHLLRERTEVRTEKEGRVERVTESYRKVRANPDLPDALFLLPASATAYVPPPLKLVEEPLKPALPKADQEVRDLTAPLTLDDIKQIRMEIHGRPFWVTEKRLVQRFLDALKSAQFYTSGGFGHAHDFLDIQLKAKDGKERESIYLHFDAHAPFSRFGPAFHQTVQELYRLDAQQTQETIRAAADGIEVWVYGVSWTDPKERAEIVDYLTKMPLSRFVYGELFESNTVLVELGVPSHSDPSDGEAVWILLDPPASGEEEDPMIGRLRAFRDNEKQKRKNREEREKKASHAASVLASTLAAYLFENDFTLPSGEDWEQKLAPYLPPRRSWELPPGEDGRPRRWALNQEYIGRRLELAPQKRGGSAPPVSQTVRRQPSYPAVFFESAAPEPVQQPPSGRRPFSMSTPGEPYVEVTDRAGVRQMQ